jgi:hypothetical protein
LPTWPGVDDCTANSDLPIVGTWHGYVESQGAPWDTLTLVIRGASVAGGVCGALTVGSGTPPAPATDPDHVYSLAPTGYIPHVVPGYTFTLLGGTTDGTRVRFSLSESEPWRSWCQLQTSYDWNLDPTTHDCRCVPDWRVSGMSDGTCRMVASPPFTDIIVDCNKVSTCIATPPPCTCVAAGCDGNLSTTNVAFDLSFAADQAEGSNDATTPNTRTRFTRAQ